MQTLSTEKDSQTYQHVQIDYNDITSMTRELEHHNVHTIISAIGLVSDETSQSQLNLIEAAENAATAQRFIPSEFSFIQTAECVYQLDPFFAVWTKSVRFTIQSPLHRPKYPVLARCSKPSEIKQLKVYPGDPGFLHGLLGNAARPH